MATTEAYYLRDLGRLVLDNALSVKESAKSSTGEQRIFESGRLIAYYEVLSLIAQQGNAFGLSPQSLSLDGFDLDSLLS